MDDRICELLTDLKEVLERHNADISWDLYTSDRLCLSIMGEPDTLDECDVMHYLGTKLYTICSSSIGRMLDTQPIDR